MVRTCLICGLRNAESNVTCLRCGDPLPAERRAAGTRDRATEPGVWRDGDILVIRKGTALPQRCLRCGLPGSNRMEHLFYWHAQALYFLILLNVLIYALVALGMRKKAVVQLNLCQAHADLRRRGFLVGWIAGGGGLIGALVSIGYPEAAFVALMVALGGAIVFARGTGLPSPVLIDDEFIRLKGAHPLFLQSLPAFGSLR